MKAPRNAVGPLLVFVWASAPIGCETLLGLGNLRAPDGSVEGGFTSDAGPSDAAGIPDAGADSGASSLDAGRDAGGDGGIACLDASWLQSAACLSGMFPLFTAVNTGGAKAYGLAIGDLDGDGTLDFVVTNNSNNSSTVFFNKSGNATFTPGPNNVASGGNPQGVAVGDLNHDGFLDFAVANVTGATVDLWLNNPSSPGAFTLSQVLLAPATSRPNAVAIGDFNGDGLLDVAATYSVATCGAQIPVWLQADGGFPQSASGPYIAGCSPWAIAAGDFRQTGQLDLAVANESGRNASVLQNLGNGTFPAAAAYPAQEDPECAAVGDLNGDGWLDVAVANGGYDNGGTHIPGFLTLLMNDRAGGFVVQQLAPDGGERATSVAVGDVNGDGRLDLVVTNQKQFAVTVLINQADGGFVRTDYGNGLPGSPSLGPFSVAIGDLNGDGALDLVVVTQDGAPYIGLNECVPVPGCVAPCVPSGGSCGTGKPCCNKAACFAGHCQ